MKAQEIEKYDKIRSNMLIGATVGLTIMFSTVVFYDFLQGTFVQNIMKVIGIIGLCIFLYSMIRIQLIKQLIRKNPDLKAALKNEWILHNLQKARAIAFFFVFISLIISCFLVIHTAIPALLLMEICLLIGVLAVQISFAFFNREQ